MDLISVIVPIYNTEKYLERCVKSIQSQTYSNLEIILVNDGSRDNSLILCEKIKNSDSRIKIINKENAGQGLARNDGLKVANGEYVTFVDSDDWISENHIANLYNEIIDNTVDAVLGNHVWVDINENKTLKMLSIREGSYKGDSLLRKLILPLIGANINDSDDIIINSSVSMNLYRRKVIVDNHIEFISERFAVAEDFFFNLDFFCNSSHIIFCKEYGYFYCQNVESTCEKYNPERFMRTINYYNLLLERIKKYGLTELVDFRAERSFLMKLRVAIRHIVMSNLPKSEKREHIKKILTFNVVENVLLKYPINSYKFSIKILTKLMKSKSVFGVYHLMYVREKGTKSKILRNFMKICGLRR